MQRALGQGKGKLCFHVFLTLNNRERYFREGPQILTHQKRENIAFLLLIGSDLRLKIPYSSDMSILPDR